MVKYYTASKSRTQGRESWAVIFRHPVRMDPGTGKPGRRVRRGLGTSDQGEADRMVEGLNELLRSPGFWEPSARSEAADRFDPRVVEIFYDGIEASTTDFKAVRDRLLPLPTQEDGYRSILLLGTTGAGKTTVVRQLLGTDPISERFPSTSTAKTTVADTELITTASGPYRAAVTFASRDEVTDHLTENVSEAALALFEGRGEAEATRRLLDHVNQRFRFSYVLGRPASSADDDDMVDDDDVVEADDVAADDRGLNEALASVGADLDVTATAEAIRSAVASLRSLVDEHAESVRQVLGGPEEDDRVIEELIEENLDAELRRTEEFHEIVDQLLDEVEKRFATLTVGELRRSRQGWPLSWAWESDDREAFIRAVSRFTSNYAPMFGRLLTPLVNGIRVAGPFTPSWRTDVPPLVLIDGEGLGHTPNSAATLSTKVAERLESVDAVLLVDSATQPMQAAPVAAMKAVAVSGNGSKLHFAFTHFDQVEGDNLPTFTAREEHVLASAQNVLKAVGDELGPAAERILHQQMDRARFFVGGIHEQLDPRRKAGRRSIDQLDRLIGMLATPPELAESGPSRPVYDRMNLSLAVAEAAKHFHSRWRGLLGVEQNPQVPKEHWTRVKALSRRLAEGRDDEYDTLKPVADLRYELQSQVYLMLQRPLRWDGGEPSDDETQAIIDEVSNAVTKRLFALTKKRISDDVRLAWQEAYSQHGPGSTFVRAKIIAADVYERGAPVPTVAASPDQNQFLKSVSTAITEVAHELNLVLE